MVRGFNSEWVPRHVRSMWEQAHRSLDRAPPHRPLMNSHAHVILELPAPKEVSMIWDLNLSASFNSQAFSRCTRNRERQSATNTPSYRCCPGSIFCSSASCATLPVHRSSPVLNPVALKVQIPMLKATVWYLMTRERERRFEDWIFIYSPIQGTSRL